MRELVAAPLLAHDVDLELHNRVLPICRLGARGHALVVRRNPQKRLAVVWRLVEQGWEIESGFAVAKQVSATWAPGNFG